MSIALNSVTASVAVAICDTISASSTSKMNPQQYPPQYPQQPGPPQGYPPQPQAGQYPQPGGYGYPGQPQQPLQQPPAQYPPQQQFPQQLNQPPAYSGYNPYPYPGEYGLAKGRKKGKGKIILGVFVVLLIVGVIVAVLVAGSSSSGGNATNNSPAVQKPTETTTSNAGADVVPRSDGQLDLSKKISSGKTLKAQVIKAKAKEQINLSSGFSFMVNTIEDYTSANPATKAGDNKKFVVATVVVGNRNQTGNISVSYLDFRLRDDANQVVAGHITTNEILSNALSNPNELKPGEQINGKIVFEVDKAASNWVLRHSETYQKTTDNTTFNVEGEIVEYLPGSDPVVTNSPAPAATPNPDSNGPLPTPAPTTN